MLYLSSSHLSSHITTSPNTSPRTGAPLINGSFTNVYNADGVVYPTLIQAQQHMAGVLFEGVGTYRIS